MEAPSVSMSYRISILLGILVALPACEFWEAPTPRPEGVVATFQVADKEQYKVRLTDPIDNEIARKLFAGEDHES